MQIKRVDSYEFDERFYQRTITNGVVEYAPSVTYVLGSVYPAHALADWKGDVGNKRASEIVEEAKQIGSFVHQQIEALIDGQQIPKEYIQSMFGSKQCLKVLRCLQAFLDWVAEYKPTFIEKEFTVWGEGYAGTVDCLAKIDGETYLIDWKTSKSIHEQNYAQIAAYGLTRDVNKLAILHLGNKTKKRYTFSVMKDDKRTKMEAQFLQSLKYFQTLHPNAKPTEETFPEIFKL